MDQKKLISACKRNDRKAQKFLVEQYSPFLYAICCRYMKDEAEAKDVLQDAFILIFQNLHTFRDEGGSFKAWIRQITVNTALQKFRRAYRKREFYPDQDIEMNVEMPSVISKMRVDELMRVISSLPDGYREVFNLYVIEGFSHRDIADQLGMKESSSRSALTRAKKMLRDKIYHLEGEKAKSTA